MNFILNKYKPVLLHFHTHYYNLNFSRIIFITCFSISLWIEEMIFFGDSQCENHAQNYFPSLKNLKAPTNSQSSLI